MREVRGRRLPANRQRGANAPGRRGTTKTARSSLPPTSFTASGLQTLASLPEVRSISLPANRQPGAEAPGNTKNREWVGEKPPPHLVCFVGLLGSNCFSP